MQTAFRTSLFQVISIQTSTGFSTGDYMTWPALAWGAMPVLMLIGACAGSTSGDEVHRMVILSRVMKNEFKRLLHQRRVADKDKQAGRRPYAYNHRTAFTFLVFLITFASILLLMGMDIPLTESIGVVVSSIGNTGPG